MWITKRRHELELGRVERERDEWHTDANRRYAAWWECRVAREQLEERLAQAEKDTERFRAESVRSERLYEERVHRIEAALNRAGLKLVRRPIHHVLQEDGSTIATMYTLCVVHKDSPEGNDDEG